ncbi:serine/threonine-protein kinase RIO1 [Galendromus occidentalis]|uniref:Serine/threonine-protein kinase RIO1 n=1 Tax=Galendromus occidentalis TaxID=34638 RepID=A0AAJ6VXT4_9ACAR|nr:serine/threonine-protein kinase RIO1 [Galendromus occidentalis]
MSGSEFHPGQFDDATEDDVADQGQLNMDKLNLSQEEYTDDDDDYYSDDFEERDDVRKQCFAQCNRQVHFQDQQKVMAGKFLSKVNLDSMWVPKQAMNHVSEQQRKSENDRIRIKDKMERATVEQVLDKRTRMILFKLLSRGVLGEINGCISTGKEANVYHASTGEDHMAIKVYKTSILIFKDRDRYVSGEFRFRGGYCSGNPRKMVRLWAEKEMRNLTRIERSGIPCPKPRLLRSHVLVMDFVGKDGWPAPKLKDVPLTESKARELYRDLIINIRKMFHECRLVHADLSEYNLLYHEGQIVFIDVSQSVEHDHPNALVFLRKDLTNVTDFFSRCGVATMTVRELFDFVVDPLISDGVDQYLERMAGLAGERGVLDPKDIQVEEEVFKNSYIPQRLDQVIDYEREVEKFQQGEDLLYKTLTGLRKVEENERPKDDPRSSSDDGSDEDDDEDNEFVGDEKDDDFDVDEKKVRKPLGRPKDESVDEKRERKKAVKDAAREKRKDKVPKHIKKRREKVGKSKK